MELDWTKSGRDWFGICGQYRAEVKGPSGPLGFSHWSVKFGDKRGNSGGTSSVRSSKKAAEAECDRLAKFHAHWMPVP